MNSQNLAATFPQYIQPVTVTIKYISPHLCTHVKSFSKTSKVLLVISYRRTSVNCITDKKTNGHEIKNQTNNNEMTNTFSSLLF